MTEPGIEAGLTLYYAPNTRAVGVRILLEELGAPYRLHRLDMQSEEQRSAEFRALNPMGKVPVIVHDGAVVTEQVAIFLYLADTFSAAGLAPPIGDPLRGPYLRWMAFEGSAFEPAVVDRAMERQAAHTAMSPYGDFDTMLGTVVGQLDRGPYLLGDRFSAADVLWANALAWTTHFKIVPPDDVIAAYTARVMSRPAVAKVREMDSTGR